MISPCSPPDPETIERFLAALRQFHPDMEFMFRHGGCYHLFVILRTLWPQAELWYVDNPGHVWTRIDRRFYDIRGGRSRKPAGARPATFRDLGRPDRWKNRLALIIDGYTAARLAEEDHKRSAGAVSRTDAAVVGKDRT